MSVDQNIRPKQDLTHFVKWPEYVHFQGQKVILSQCLRVPPAIAQVSHTLNKDTVTQLFKLLDQCVNLCCVLFAHALFRYRPETNQDKKARLDALAKATAEEKEAQAKVRFQRNLLYPTS